MDGTDRRQEILAQMKLEIAREIAERRRRLREREGRVAEMLAARGAKSCLICGAPAVLERHGFAYCAEHIPEDADDFDPEEHEGEVIERFRGK